MADYKIPDCVTKTMVVNRDEGYIEVTTITPFWENVPEENRVTLNTVRTEQTYYRSSINTTLVARLQQPLCRASVAASKMDVKMHNYKPHLRKPCCYEPVGGDDLCPVHGGTQRLSNPNKSKAELAAENEELKAKLAKLEGKS